MRRPPRSGVLRAAAGDDGHPELPLDGDVEAPGPLERTPPYRRPALVALVFLGGAAGTLARWGTGLLVPRVARVPLSTLTVNLVGAFVLGALLEHLAGRGPDRGRPRLLRVSLGTGFCGGFTTYSALANDTAGLLRDGLVGRAVAYAAVTVVLGLAACALGIAVGRRRSA